MDKLLQKQAHRVLGEPSSQILKATHSPFGCAALGHSAINLGALSGVEQEEALQQVHAVTQAALPLEHVTQQI